MGWVNFKSTLLNYKSNKRIYVDRFQCSLRQAVRIQMYGLEIELHVFVDGKRRACSTWTC